MAKVRKTSSDSPRASAEPAVRIPISILVGSFDPAARTPELNEAEHRALVALRSDARRAEVGTEFDPRRLLREGMTERQRAAWRRRRGKWLKRLFRDDPRVVAGR